MISPRRVFGLAALPLLVGLAASPPEALPQAPPPAEGDTFDPYAEPDPATAVAQEDGSVYARLRHIEGGVSLRRDHQIRDDLSFNEPVIPGDRIDTTDGRAEIQFSDGTLLRLDAGTTLVVRSLSDNANQIENSTILQLPAGSLIVRTDRLDSRMERFQIDTPAASIFILSEGLYRVDVRADGPTVIASRGGAAEVMAMDVSNIVRSGERTFVTPGHAPLEPQVFNTLRSDEFDEWSEARDEEHLWRQTAETRVPPGVPDPVEPYAEELSYYGQWINTPSYGWVWRPVGVTQDWRPYYHGRWVWSPAGMVWASYEPWGWAPYHYGRWEFLIGGGWVWIPGYVYSGAHVAWLYSPGYFGWAPLGYYDYPVHIGFHFGLFYSPWVYVHGHHLYHHNIHTVCVKEKTIIQTIEKQYVVVGGSPRITPEQVASRPRIADDVHRRVAARREIQVDTTRGGRQVPFNVTERQQLARATSQRSRGAGVGVRSVSRNGGRPASLVPQNRGVSVPKSAARPGGAPVRRQGTQPATPSQTQGASPARPSAQQRREPLRKPGAPPLEESVPRQVIPRIIPRGSSTGDTSSPGATTRQPGSSPDRPNAQPAQPGGQQNGKTPANGKRPVRRPAKKATTGGEKPAEEKTPSQSGDGRASRSTAARPSVVMARYNPYETSSTGRSAAVVGARRPASAPERVGAAPARASAPAPAPRQAVSSRPARRASSSQGDRAFSRSAGSTAPARVSAQRGGGGGTPKAKASSGKASGGKGSRQARSRAKSDEPRR